MEIKLLNRRTDATATNDYIATKINNAALFQENHVTCGVKRK